MNREIKFRAKRSDNGDWVYGYYMAVAGTHKILTFNPDSASGAIYYDVEPSTLGQFTGLEDVKGKKIYEDDIVLLDFGDENKSYEVASFKNGRFVTIDPQKPYRDEAICVFVKYMEVVGNIYDDSERLKI